MIEFKFFHIYTQINQYELNYFPFIMRIFGQTIATDLVSVQPMNPPTGQLHFIDFNNGENPNNSRRRIGCKNFKFFYTYRQELIEHLGDTII